MLLEVFPNRFNVILEVYAFLLVNLEKKISNEDDDDASQEKSDEEDEDLQDEEHDDICMHAIKRR